MTYIYDFGDDWVHDITLETVSKPDGGRQLPRCTDGSGAAHCEDIGGVWAWTKKVRAANDPEHQDHEFCREQLGLEPGESVDLSAIDQQHAGAALGRLR